MSTRYRPPSSLTAYIVPFKLARPVTLPPGPEPSTLIRTFGGTTTEPRFSRTNEPR